MIEEDEKEQATIHIDLNESPGASIALPPEVNVGGNLCFADVLPRKASLHYRSATYPTEKWRHRAPMSQV